MAETDTSKFRNTQQPNPQRCQMAAPVMAAPVMVALLIVAMAPSIAYPQQTLEEHTTAEPASHADLEIDPVPTPANIPTSPLPTSPLPTSPLPTSTIATSTIATSPLPTTPVVTAPAPTKALPTTALPTPVIPTAASARPSPPAGQEPAPSWLSSPAEQAWTSPSGLSRTLQTALGLSVLSLAPAILLMTTSFVRISVVLGLLRQSLGTQMVPSNQVITSLALFMTILIMAPVWQQVYTDAIEPYTNPDVEMQWQDAWARGVTPVRDFMSQQIDIADNGQDIWLFYEYLPEDTPEPETYADIPLQVLLPAFLLSELKTAFLIGFRIYLPFLIVDLVVSSVTTSMGMMMLPPMMVSLPLKLMLFVLVDGWHLVVGMLLQSFGTIGL